jgi:curved DNA-binding protein CbpA
MALISRLRNNFRGPRRNVAIEVEAKKKQRAAKAEAFKKEAETAAAVAAEAIKLQKSECDKLIKKIAKMGPVKALGLSLLSTDDEIQEAYEEHSLEVHPDKNNAPNAKEAFQALTKARDDARREIGRARRDAAAAKAEADALRRKQAEEAAALRLQKSKCDELIKKIAKVGPVKALGLSLLSTDDDIREAYQDLSLEFDPDENNAPNVKEAFQALTKALADAKLEIGRARRDARAKSLRFHEAEDARRDAEAQARRFQEEARQDWRCIALTRTGLRCKRAAQTGRQYCWQHPLPLEA